MNTARRTRRPLRAQDRADYPLTLLGSQDPRVRAEGERMLLVQNLTINIINGNWDEVTEATNQLEGGWGFEPIEEDPVEENPAILPSDDHYVGY